MPRLIDRDALIDELKKAEEGSFVAVEIIKATGKYTAESIAATSFSVVRGVVNSAPSIDPVKHGRWILKDDCYPFDTVYQCSVCGDEFTLIEGNIEENHYKFCPNCGSCMDEERTEKQC